MLIKESYFKKVLKQEFRNLFEATTSPAVITRGQNFTDADFGINPLGYHPSTNEQTNAGTLWRTSSIQNSTDLAHLMFGTFPKLTSSGPYASLLSLFQRQNSEPTDDLINRVFMVWDNVDQYNSPQRFPYNFRDKAKGVIKNYLHHAYLLNNANGSAAPAAQTASPASPAAAPAAQTAAPAAAQTAAQTAAAPTASTAQTSYTIKRGDTVATIIQKNYGFNPRFWNTLLPAEKTKLMSIFNTKDLDKINAGVKILLPASLFLGRRNYNKIP